MTFPATDANGATVQLLTAAELTTLLTAAASTTLPTGAATQTTLAAVLTALGTPAQAAAQTALQASIDRTTPGDTVFAITPSDSTDLATIPDALYVVATGTLSIKDSTGTTISLGSPPTGAVLPIRARRVMATGTTATVVGLV